MTLPTYTGCLCCSGGTPDPCPCSGVFAIPDTIYFGLQADLGFLSAFQCIALNKISRGHWAGSAGGITYTFDCTIEGFAFRADNGTDFIVLAFIYTYRCLPFCLQGSFEYSADSSTADGVIGLVPPCIDPGADLYITLTSDDPAIDGTSHLMTYDPLLAAWSYGTDPCGPLNESIPFFFGWQDCAWVLQWQCQGENSPDGHFYCDGGVGVDILAIHSSGTFISVDILAHADGTCPEFGPCCVSAVTITN